MISWETFETKISRNIWVNINNNSNKNIVLFGNCQMATIGYMLNELLDYKYNIYIIISWYWDKNGLENFDMKKINEEIYKLIQKCDIFLFHKHIKDYGVHASYLPDCVNKNAICLQIPNIRLVYNTLNKMDFDHSLGVLEYNIKHSDFPDFIFVYDYIFLVRFFNNPEHPTHYLLFLIAKAVCSKLITKNYQYINIYYYYNAKNRRQFRALKEYVILPDKKEFTIDMSNITGITMNADYFD
jgi:hypothetical protein